MDYVAIWTAVGSVVGVLMLCGAIVGVIRKGDSMIYDDKINAVDAKVISLSVAVADKAHKDDVKRIEARFEKDITDLRADQKAGFAEIRGDIKDMRTAFLEAIQSNAVDRLYTRRSSDKKE